MVSPFVYIIFASGGENKLSVRSRMSAFAPCLHGIYMEGIVNYAIYQHYLEHTRHEFLASSGISFIEMHERGVDPVVNRIEINYKTPLRSRDKFISKLYMRREGIKYVFYQDIYKTSGETCIKAVVETVCTVNGRISRGEEFLPYFEKYLQ